MNSHRSFDELGCYFCGQMELEVEQLPRFLTDIEVTRSIFFQYFPPTQYDIPLSTALEKHKTQLLRRTQ